MKILRYIGYLLLGGIVGGIIGGILGNFDGLGIENLTFATYNNVVVISIVATMIIILVEAIVLMNQRRALKYKRLVDEEVDIDATDQYELLANRYVLNGSILSVIQTIIAFVVLLIFVVGQAEANAMLFFLIPFFASAIFNTQFTLFNRKFDDRMPKIAVLHQMWWVYNLKNYFKLQLLEFLLLGGQSIIGLGCLLFFSFV
ncbi:DUF3169 family protein [Staphylococcus aureus]|uniref:DUF3169 family protein n=1 Tax=Staphylococcus aureus TaxID=1280 RepID=UPI001F48F4AA|nr:DUF3169 family protein [Staphylococcus aureus]MCF8765002.1 DUF3169 family protein [Staphylococcus aureus]UKB89505.1 DUF3169 family protein [Staphylococcus aureus]